MVSLTSLSSDLSRTIGSSKERHLVDKTRLAGKLRLPITRTRGQRNKRTMPLMPENVEGREIHTLFPLGAVRGLLASTSLSKRRMKAELREMENARRVCLPINAVVQEANSIQFGEQDKTGIVYPNVDPVVIKGKIMGMTVHRLLVDGDAFCNILFKSTLDKQATLLTTWSPANTLPKDLETPQ